MMKDAKLQAVKNTKPLMIAWPKQFASEYEY